ncbi:MAG: hypothetical protein LBI14_02950 [Treponema sp.]|jgi:uncharacterized integral membrane protein|nr:hypothetical protein [Treponema sp.]
MMRLIGFLLVFAIFLIFIGVNLDNKCDINYWFGENNSIKDVPVYITALVSLFIGIICSFPLIALIRRKKNPPNELNDPKESKKKNKKASISTSDQIPGENGPYGID